MHEGRATVPEVPLRGLRFGGMKAARVDALTLGLLIGLVTIGIGAGIANSNRTPDVSGQVLYGHSEGTFNWALFGPWAAAGIVSIMLGVMGWSICRAIANAAGES